MNFTTQALPDVQNIHKIYFVGVKGVGMAPLALIAKGAGLTVAGSDIKEEFITDKYLNEKEIPIYNGFSNDNISSFFGESKENSLVVTTGAHKGFDNPEVIAAKKLGIPVVTQGQALSLMMEGDIFGRILRGISVAGSHGKTTTTSLLATVMKVIGLDPSYVIGTGEVFPLGAPGHYGQGEYFVAEADEYVSEPVHDRVPKFLYQHPYIAIFNNIDFDHPDQFENIETVEKAFEEFAYKVKSGGMLFINGDDKRLLKLKNNIVKDIKIITYGKNSSNDYVVSKIVTHATTKFAVTKKGKELDVFEIKLIGEHNATNALAVVAVLNELGFESHKIKICLTAFEGSKRRSEVLGTAGEALVIDDYGHHPLEIATTIAGVKMAYSNKKVVCIFQPHTYSRTKALISDFSVSFKGVEELILLPVFKSSRDTESDSISHDEIVAVFQQNIRTHFFEKKEDVVEYVRQNYLSSDYLILTIGAGDVYKIGVELIKK